MIQVKVVCEGYLRREAGVICEAHSTATLIVDERFLVLVDTSSERYREKLLSGLRAVGVRPEEIAVVVSTHLHHDHIGNNDLFPNATRLARIEEAPGVDYETVTGNLDLQEGISLVHTPGHTRGSMSVMVDAEDGRYVIAGDAIPIKDNYDKWIAPLLRYDEATALRSMRRIAEEADFIVPGHGPLFRNERRR